MMPVVIPYVGSKFYDNGDGLISPNGEIFYTKDASEFWASDYLYGPNWFNDNDSEFQSSKLTKEELELFKIWLDEYYFTHQRAMLTEFLVYFLDFDQVISRSYSSIITTSDIPHIRLYNYYLMKWNIVTKLPKHYNPQTNRLEAYVREGFNDRHIEDMKALQEIEEIKRDVPDLKARIRYLK